MPLRDRVGRQRGGLRRGPDSGFGPEFAGDNGGTGILLICRDYNNKHWPISGSRLLDFLTS